MMSNTSERKTGTLEKFEPLYDSEGNHRTWSSQTRNQVYYVFISTFKREDGTIDEGEMSSIKDSPSWKTGILYNYDIVVSGDQNQFKRFTNVKAVQQQGGGKPGYGRKKLTPEERDRIIRSVALESAIYGLIELGLTDKANSWNSIEATANKLFLYVKQQSKEDEKKEMMLENSLRRGIDGIQLKKLKDNFIQGEEQNEEGIQSSDQLLRFSFRCFQYIWNGKQSEEENKRFLEGK